MSDIHINYSDTNIGRTEIATIVGRSIYMREDVAPPTQTEWELGGMLRFHQKHQCPKTAVVGQNDQLWTALIIGEATYS